jgi:hypothetical protein
MLIVDKLDEAVNSINSATMPFIVKGFVDKVACDAVLVELQNYQLKFRQNERFHGDNWHYLVNKKDIQFTSFSFNSLNSLPSSNLVSMYSKMFDAYTVLGDDIQQDFEFHTQNNLDGRTINPLVFWYPHSIGQFDWH